MILVLFGELFSGDSVQLLQSMFTINGISKLKNKIWIDVLDERQCMDTFNISSKNSVEWVHTPIQVKPHYYTE